MKTIFYIIKRIIIGVGIALAIMLIKSNVFALANTQEIVEINISYTTSGESVSTTMRPPNTLWVYDNQYFSDMQTTGNLYLLGYWETQIDNWYFDTKNINWYFPSSCSSSEMLNYTMNIYFYCQSTYCPTQPMNISMGTNTCTGNWLQGTTNPIYQINCNAPAGSLPLGSLYFTSKYIGKLNYRIGIQKNFNYTCDVNSQAIIENQNVNTDRTIQAITDMNGNITIVNNSITQVNDTLNDDEIDQNQANSFFNDFDSGNTGSIFDIINLPLTFIDKMNDTCSPITFPTIPYINITLTLPCVSTYYKMIPGLHEILLIVVGGFLSYLIIKEWIELIQKLKNPNDDEIEVLDL